MSVQPSVEQAMRRLRLDGGLAEDVQDALDAALAEAQGYLDGTLYATAEEAAGDSRGVVLTKDILSAQLLLTDALVGANDSAAVELKRRTAFTILRQHRNVGC